VTGRPIRAVLDTSAVVAYAGGSISVGELLAEIADEHADVAIPDLCLAEAAARLDPGAWPALDVLVGLPHCLILPLPDWRDVALLAPTLGLTRAAALVWAAAHGAHLLTAGPDRYGDPDVSIIEV